MKYVVHNTVRARHTRSLRVLAAQHPRQRVHVGDSQMRVVRGRPLYITEEQLRRYQAELQDKAHQGVLEVRTASGQLVDLATLKVAPPPVAPPIPHVRLDSIANDDPGPMIRIPPAGDLDETIPGEPSLFANLGGDDEEGGDEGEAAQGDAPVDSPFVATPADRNAKLPFVIGGEDEGEEGTEEVAEESATDATAPEDTAKKRRPRKGKEK